MNDMTGFAEHYGHWGLVAIMIVLASWILYRFAAPKGWRQWTGAGLVQAFIIALYAEMYGFPLTIYLLTGFFGIDIPRTAFTGHLWATLLGYGETGAMLEMLLGGVFVLFGISLLVVGWRAVYLSTREGRMEVDGLYGVVRHPQYSGIMLAVFGQIVHWPTVVTLALFPVIVLAYVRLARKEEREMIRRFGAEYEAYLHRVPMFFPHWGQWGQFLNPLEW
ncbi:isoprenylcysteine carboxylmethyltransferase family protein [Paraburkholderia fungorum]|jgi:methanethiol S-methyltransferase|uniref:Isoprenylcysteine carboxyl methyltransferase family protein n=1 Tax=Paraburkholderia fungorum TaxID=134537 RepID=A0AAW3V564_9BURK|nr:isoprenylcysteine carboxylmethyltransferase family protein [Paraburkholderia fungorum]AJZ56149.1 isoprenylcysteine carboxyl methyltransferase family protein [Paraburkholderia fungorum]MBB4516540.1 protein-S-isoprenylcysteine O-methyltransferase Ste14 [Paraburkholderia fungorum]MBB5545202.1 protein-S-isoprenylcysteine O-methyltransferase Ste14 [Paraburkholderia fungorum]MBB6204987.1 protein-S-isoprenylcysteine O-methyltransferase Ste14 [Paraburkholderia fungorum]MBU7440602.1 isoprenylcystein